MKNRIQCFASAWRSALLITGLLLGFGISSGQCLAQKAPEGMERLVYHEWNKRLGNLSTQIKQAEGLKKSRLLVNETTLFVFIYWYHCHKSKNLQVYPDFDSAVRWLGDWILEEGGPSNYLEKYGNAFIKERKATVDELKSWREIDILPIDKSIFVNQVSFRKLISEFDQWLRRKGGGQNK